MKKVALLLFILIATAIPVLPQNVKLGGGVIVGGTTNINIVGPPTIQYVAPQPVSGCGVEWTGLLNFTVGTCTYTIGGVTQTTALTNITLDPADVTDPRIELIYIDGPTNTVTYDAGAPAPSPAVPVEDPSTTLALTSVLVDANATVPTTSTRYDIYHTDSSDWACSKGGTNSNRINCTSTNNPYDTTQDIEFGDGGTVGSTGYAQLQYASTVDVSTTDNLIFYIRNKAQWPATRSLTVQFYSGGTAKGTPVILSGGAFGFNATTNFTSYQQIVIPTTAFNAAGISVNQLRVIVSGTGTALTGFYLDDITLQGGVVVPPVVLPTTLMNWRGTWNPTIAYKPNDTVVQGGVGYVALVANTNVSLATASTWAQLGPIPGFVSRSVTGTTDTVLASDNIRGVNYSSGSSVAVALPTSATLGIATFALHLVASGVGTVTVTPASSWPVYTNGNSSLTNATLAITPGQDCLVSVDIAGAAWDAFCTGAGGSTVQVNGSDVSSPNFNATTPAAPANGKNIAFAVSSSDVSAALVGDGDTTHFYRGDGTFAIPAGGSVTTTHYIPLPNCTSDQTGNAVYVPIALTNTFRSQWQMIPGAASYINCEIIIPDAIAGTPNASIVVYIAANDGTAGHTANFQSCDAIYAVGASLNVAAPTCAANQAFTTTSTAYNVVALTFAVQATLVKDEFLSVQIKTSTTGTQPTANMLVNAYLKIDETM